MGTGAFTVNGGDAGINANPTNYGVPWAGGGGGGIIAVHCNSIIGPFNFQVTGGISLKGGNPPNGKDGKGVFA